MVSAGDYNKESQKFMLCLKKANSKMQSEIVVQQ